MSKFTSVVAATCAVMLLPAAMAAEQQAPSRPVEAPVATPASTGTITATPTETNQGRRQESEPEWPQSRCEAPAE